MMDPFLSARKIVKQFPGVMANDHVDFDVERGEIHALLGENGAGKSTLMQILYGLYSRDSGEILVDGSPVELATPAESIQAGIGMIHQEFMLVRKFSVTENIILGLKDDDHGGHLDLATASARISKLSASYGLQVDPNEIIEHLPVGVQQRVEILKLLYRKATMLILDEPTAVLTPQETKAFFKVLRKLAAQGHAVVIVTHKLHEIMEISDQVTIMRDGQVVTSVATRDSSEAELARLMVGRDVELGTDRATQVLGAPVLDIANLTVKDERGYTAVHDLSLVLHAGEIVGLAGVDGNGQSELAQALMNLRPVQSGQVTLLGRDITHASPAAHIAARLAYVPADRRHVGTVAELPITMNAVLGDQGSYTGRLGLLDFDRIRDFTKTLMKRFDVRPDNPDYSAGKLSGGNLQKVQMGRAISADPVAMIVEQPTRGLDVGAIEAVWGEILAQRDAGKAVLLISAELQEILNLADRIAVIYEGRIVGILSADQAEISQIGLMMTGSYHTTENGAHHVTA
ncbi:MULTISPECIES: ABC transporter ATP-binding protein [Roseobacteraceae]|uniref:Ribose import ATP-binding protein RbsA n=1 Tax=Pseudosulfitobacter pseudonitzschiae TaxID=1402135 RepID=A0A221K8D1_9RHOB|nr:ABC transporter ATP-binding protein [Sulfitobacter sp. DFL-23]ASM75239.1 ribose import ATP-binding protein RbsA [Pseudosulfitobacter pseudonitzschiae]